MEVSSNSMNVARVTVSAMTQGLMAWRAARLWALGLWVLRVPVAGAARFLPAPSASLLPSRWASLLNRWHTVGTPGPRESSEKETNQSLKASDSVEASLDAFLL